MYVLTPVCMSAHYTEASKKILQYLAACSGHAGAVDVVKDRLLESTPVLEVRTYAFVTPLIKVHSTACTMISLMLLRSLLWIAW